MDPCELARRIDNTLIRPNATVDELKRFCMDSVRYPFNAVYVPLWFLPKAAGILEVAGLTPATVIGFPHGTEPIELKVSEARWAVSRGAGAVDYVINISMGKSGNYSYIFEEAEKIVKASEGAVVKAIVEVGYFNKDELKGLVEALIDAGVHYIKTSTGFGPRGVSVEDVRLLKTLIGGRARIKAAGGIRDLDYALRLLQEGADLLGTSSGIKIVREAVQRLL